MYIGRNEKSTVLVAGTTYTVLDEYFYSNLNNFILTKILIFATVS